MEFSRILLIRHATTDRVGKALSGWLPGIPLDDAGQAQALALVERVAGVKIDAIYSSPIQRAMETARPLSLSRDIEISENPDLGEVNFGVWQGQFLSSIQTSEEFTRFNGFRSCTRAPGGELMLETQARIVRALISISQGHFGETIAVFSHADAIKAAVMHCLGIPIDFHERLEIGTTSVTELLWNSVMVRVIRVNNSGNI